MSIRTVLSEVGVPVRRPDYKGNAAQYITYQMLGQTGTIWAESTEAETGTEFMINIWSKTDWTQLLTAVKHTLLRNRYRVTVLSEVFEKEDGYYRVILEASCIGAHYG